MNPVISISTSFLQSRAPKDGYAMMAKARELGYEYVELGHAIPVVLLDGIFRAVEEGVVKISSVHNFCPVPPFASGATPNLFSPSTKSAAESQMWRQHTLSSIDVAARTGAKAVVSHSGKLSYFMFRPEVGMEKAFGDCKMSELRDTPQAAKIRDSFIKSTGRRALAKDYKFLEKNLAEISPDLEKAGVFIGVENRDGLSELPLDWTFAELFEKLSKIPAVKAWHDLGHSKKKELQFLYSQQRLIEETLPHIGGWHIHDCDADGRDHIALGEGCIDFAALRKYFDPSKHIFTLELNAKVRSAQAADSLKRFRDLLV